MNKYVFGAMAAFALAVPAAGNAATFPIGSANFFITSGTPFTPSITASFFNGFQTSTTFDDSFTFTIPQNGVGSGSISTSFSATDANKLTITNLFVNGVSYALTATASGQSATVGNIPIALGVLNTIRVTGFTQGSGRLFRHGHLRRSAGSGARCLGADDRRLRRDRRGFPSPLDESRFS